MNLESVFPFSVCVLPPPPRNASRTVSYPNYIHEILTHAGLAYGGVDYVDLSDALPAIRVLLTVGDSKFDSSVTNKLAEWVRAGGHWISIAGTLGLPVLLGVVEQEPSISSWGGGAANLGEGYLAGRTGGAHPILDGLERPLHYFNGLPVEIESQTSGAFSMGNVARVIARCLDAHQRETSRPAIVEKLSGKGKTILIAPDLTGTIVRIQQGVGVTRDGIPAADGSGPLCDDVLKSGDGSALDWIFDRKPVDGVRGLHAFTQPIADLWRDLLLRTIFYCAASAQVRLPVLWYWPRNLPAVAHLSLDTDSNEPQKAEKMLEILRRNDVRATWCVILPGYERELLGRISAGGHELAMHYDAMSEGLDWAERQFIRQFNKLTSLFGTPPRTNKNHYLRWEGDCELFDWCASRGITFDQSKGASKTGEAGFNFGTCHPYFPVRFSGEIIDVMELPTPTQDLAMFAPPELLAPLKAAALEHFGVMHLLFHPYHIVNEPVAVALEAAIRSAREDGMEWWTAAELDRWERSRRGAVWSRENGKTVLKSKGPLKAATILQLNAEKGELTRWKTGFQVTQKDIAADEAIVLD